MDKNMDKMTIAKEYKNVTLSVEHTGMWRFCWYNINPATGELERIRKTLGINRIADQVEKLGEARVICCFAVKKQIWQTIIKH